MLRLDRVEATYTPRTDDLGLYTEKRKAVALNDVKGIDSIKPQAKELIDILKDPQAYFALGAEMPRGVLLYGKPGTGKTMFAQAIAHESGLPFLYSSSGALAGRYAHYGDSAIASFFSQARRNAPCIVFIDEIDGIGQVRTGSSGNPLLQSLLAGIDALPRHKLILFIAATNRPEILDPALIRSGRFDRKYSLEPPNRKGREAIIKNLIKNYEVKALDVAATARLTAGFTGAQLVNLLNESALLARRTGHNTISQGVVQQTIDLVKFGPETLILTDPASKKRVAVHELGHAIVALEPKTETLRRLTIVSRSRFLGMSEMAADENFPERHRAYWLNRIAVLFGGRIAELMMYGKENGQTPGAESDLERATRIATSMVCQWGMADNLRGGFFSIREDLLGQETKSMLFHSENTAEALDRAVQSLLKEGEDLAGKALMKWKASLPVWADILAEGEEMSGEFLEKLMKTSKNGK